ncbi:radical SAM protein [candidate division WWE3 bacterium]|uniref:Radical SAM protein n=1 Tax=candidate division WWE3 bacterium TaxID=2053526 RepID=A0A7X9DLE6_UNCKA|nr:radical SAM protein [candidate division WWE3 bacterium]
MPYRLKDGVYLVEGATRGAILDTNSGLVYSVNGIACQIVNYRSENNTYWGQLVQMGLAETCVSSPGISAIQPLKDTERLKFVWFEVVTDDCNECCEHCYAGSMPRTYRKEMGFAENALQELIAQPERKKMRHSDWLRLMKEAYDLGCRAGQLIGGEPFLYKGENGETLLDLAQYLVELGYTRVEIYSNGTLLTPEKVKLIKTLGVHVAISLYSSDPSTHDLVTRTPGSHAKTMRAIQWLKEASVPLRVETVLMKRNQETIAETTALKETLDVVGRHPDPLRPKGRGVNPLLQPDFEYVVRYGLMLKPNFTAETDTVSHYSSGHSCLLGKITVTEFGEVLPCIFSHDNVVGNVLVAPSLESVLREPVLTRIWRATKDGVMVCRDCEYRYVCFDCRPLSEGASAGNAGYLTAPYPRCTYNPYTGEWGQGLWKVDELGYAFYDRTLAAEIQEVARTMSESVTAQVAH